MEATESHDRARELCERSGGPDQLLAVLVADRIRHWRNARYRAGIEVTERIVRLAGQRDDALQVLFGRLMAGWPHLGLGNLEVLGPAADEVLAAYDPHKQRTFAYYYGLDLRVVALGLRGYHQSLRGLPDQALESGAAAVAWARELNHAGSLVWALSWAGAQPAAMRRDARAAGTFASEVLAMPEKRRSPVDLAWGRVLAGWSIGKSGQLAQGVALLREAKAMGNRHVTRFAKTIESHLETILAWYDHHITSGPLEGLNNKCKVLKRSAYGYRDLEFFALRLMFIPENSLQLTAT